MTEPAAPTSAAREGTPAPEASALDKVYDPHAVEVAMARLWDAAEAFHAVPGGDGSAAAAARQPFAIVIPPPNVTAALHIGHALNNTLQDVLVRWRRMAGDDAVWIPGTDHAGIATQTVVEKRVLAEEGKRRTDFPREAFVARIHAWKEEYEARILHQLRQMGASCDWSRTRFTMDPVCARAVREAFFRLFRDGLVYRGKRLVNWDPVTQTALADDEVEDHEVATSFWYLRYPVVDDAGLDTGRFVTVATTRPETMLGDTAVAVNPGDPALAALVGARVRLPIVNRVIPVIADDYVVLPDPDSSEPKARYASGFLKVTPAHDPNDWEIGRRHGLAVINVMAPDASISLDHGWPAEDAAKAEPFLRDALAGKDRYAARAAVVAWFQERGLLAEVKPYTHSIGHSYRSHAPIEPYLSDQWYVRVTDDRLAGAALRAMAPEQRAESGGCAWKAGGSFEAAGAAPGWEGGLRFYPARYARTFQSWHEGIRDWCVSRQLWWGHRIPVWSRAERGDAVVLPVARDDPRVAARVDDATTHVCLAEDAPDLIAALEAAGFVQDPDVLDTWFSSALWPLSVFGWPDPERFPGDLPEGRRALERWNPTRVLCTAREIITLWVSRMVMFNLHFRGCLPFADVFIHAMIQDGEGQKMSKSLGNGVDPLDIVASHGADAMRFTLAAMTTDTQDLRLPVSCVCPHTGESFAPEMIVTASGHRVMAPTQKCPSDPKKRMVTSYGEASGHVKRSADAPLARNTSPKFDQGRAFANKLWNAGRFAMQRLEGHRDTPDVGAAARRSLADRWVLSRIARAIADTDRALAGYQFNQYAQGVYDVFWRDFCDWYLEAVKPVVSEPSGAGAAARSTLAACLDALLRLLHPAMPYVTEALWQRLGEVRGERAVEGLPLAPSALCVRAAWPAASGLVDDAVEARFARVQEIAAAIRTIRTEYKVPPKRTVTVRLGLGADLAGALFDEEARLVETLAGASVSAVGAGLAAHATSAVASAAGTQIFVDDLIDPAAERKRLDKVVGDLLKKEQGLRGRLANPGYAERAPAHLVEETRAQLAAVERERVAMEAKLAGLGT